MISRLRSLSGHLTPAQTLLVGAVFVLSSVLALGLAIWLARRNRRADTLGA